MMRLMRRQTMKFDESLLEMIGKTYKEIKTRWGAAEGIYAFGGEIGFIFRNLVCYYFENEYDVTAIEPKDGSECYGIGSKFSTFIDGMSKKRYDIAEIEERLGVDIAGFITDDEDEIGAGFSYTYEFEYNGLLFRFYSDSLQEVESSCILFAYKNV